jgi:hypothetical protein
LSFAIVRVGKKRGLGAALFFSVCWISFQQVPQEALSLLPQAFFAFPSHVSCLQVEEVLL